MSHPYRPEKPNSLAKMVYSLNKAPLFMRSWLMSKAFGSKIPFAGRASLRIQHLDHERCEIKLSNRKKNQNHIGTLHAAAMALAAESATGYLVGMNVPNGKIPVIKQLSVTFEKRTKGSIIAKAHLTPEQIESMHTQEKGEVLVAVTITDEDNKNPVQCAMLWAWTPKRT